MGVELVGPPLPAEHAGKAIVWTPWREHVGVCGRMVVERPCKGCGYAEPRGIAYGCVDGAQRAYGHYCPGCKELWVYWRVPPAPGEYVGRLDLIVHTTGQERIEAAMKRLGARLEQALRAEMRRTFNRDRRRSLAQLAALASRTGRGVCDRE